MEEPVIKKVCSILLHDLLPIIECYFGGCCRKSWRIKVPICGHSCAKFPHYRWQHTTLALHLSNTRTREWVETWQLFDISSCHQLFTKQNIITSFCDWKKNLSFVFDVFSFQNWCNATFTTRGLLQEARGYRVKKYIESSQWCRAWLGWHDLSICWWWISYNQPQSRVRIKIKHESEAKLAKSSKRSPISLPVTRQFWHRYPDRPSLSSESLSESLAELRSTGNRRANNAHLAYLS